MTASKTSAIVLAAGQGTRMKSETPKVLHPVAGRPMIWHVVSASLEAGASDVVVVVGHGREAVVGYLERAFGERVRFAVQAEQRGTGHAVQCALPELTREASDVLVLCGDTPLIEATTLAALLAAWREATGASMAMLTCEVDDPTGYGRIVRGPTGAVVGIREHRDCDVQQRAINEINPGVYVFSTAFLGETLPRLSARNAQGELYLTDTVEHAAGRASVGVATLRADAATLVGVNDRVQLFEVERALHRRIADRWRRAGVTVREGAIIDVGARLEADVTVEPGAVIRGASEVRRGARVDAGAVLDDAVIGESAHVKPHSVVVSSSVGAGAQIGPFAHLRPGSHIGDDAHVGNFVETKNTTLRRGAKANHLAYLGDGDVGEGANIGAGTIFCNYDGFQKHRTTIGAGAFIGSDSQLVAPITVGDGAYVATGTTVTKDVPADGLAIGRVAQQNKEGYAARLRGRLRAAADASRKKLSRGGDARAPRCGRMAPAARATMLTRRQPTTCTRCRGRGDRAGRGACVGAWPRGSRASEG